MFGRVLSILLTVLVIIRNALRSGNIWQYIITSLRLAFPAFAAMVPRFFAFIQGFWLIATGMVVGTIAAGDWMRRWVVGLYRSGYPTILEPYLPLGLLLALIGAAQASASWVINYKMEVFRRLEHKEEPLLRPGVDQMVTLYGRGIVGTNVFNEYLLEEGYDTPERQRLLDLYYNDASVNDILDDFHRNERDYLATEQRLIQKGLVPKAARLLIDNSYKILSIDQLLQVRLKGYMQTDVVFYKMGAELGYKPLELDLLVAANGEPISIGQALDLWNKQEGAQLAINLGVANEIEKEWAEGKGEDDVNRAVVEGPLNNYWFPAIKKLRYNMLGAADYIRFAVRDVYNPKIRELSKLDDNPQPILEAKLKMLGYSPQDAKDAWAAHWELPSPTQVFEMLHRDKLPPGLDVEKYLASADYAPAWRKALTDISYNPITRTDAKRMYKLRGDLDELIRHFKDNGYTEADAKDLAEFTKQDVNLEGNNERRSLSSGLKNAVLSMYKGRTISADEVRDVLRQLTYTDETIEQFILEADFFRIQDEKADVAGALKTAYVKALRTREDTVALLQQAGWNGQPLDDLMGTWDLLRAVTELQPHQVASRDLTKAELVAAFKEEIITDEQLMDALMQLGYDHDESTVIQRLASLSMEKARRNDQIEVVHQSFLAGALDLEGTALELEKISVPYLQKNNLISKWLYEQAKRLPDFTLAQLEGMIYAKVMDESVAQKYLAAQGYSQEQQTYLLSWWLGKRTPQPFATTLTRLSRKDIESMYISDKGKRNAAHDALKGLGYSESEIAFVLDNIDKNLKR